MDAREMVVVLMLKNSKRSILMICEEKFLPELLFFYEI